MPWDIPDVHTDVTWGQWDLSLDLSEQQQGTGGYLISLSGSTRSLQANSPCVQSDESQTQTGIKDYSHMSRACERLNSAA